MSYTEPLEKLMRRARNETASDIGHMGIPDLVELAYKSGAHDKFYEMEGEISGLKEKLIEADVELALVKDYPKCEGHELPKMAELMKEDAALKSLLSESAEVLEKALIPEIEQSKLLAGFGEREQTPLEIEISRLTAKIREALKS